MSVEAVVFDIGNVLLGWEPEQYYDRVYGLERRQRLFSEADLHRMNLLVDEGHDFTDTIYGWAGTYPEYEREILDWHDNWLELATGVIHHSVRLLRALKRKRVPVFSLTNFGVKTLEIAKQNFEFLNEFDKEYVSGHLKLLKPDPKIYEVVEKDCGVAPARLLYADDRPENIAAAEARGWQGHVFTAPEGFAARLVEVGLLTPGEAK
jgi:2-haloacid dehalogenase